MQTKTWTDWHKRIEALLAKALTASSAGLQTTIALRNRSVLIPPEVLVVPFTPATTPATSLIAATIFTPKVSGVIVVSASLAVANGGTADTYSLAMQVATGTGLSVTGGAGTSNGWTFGSTVPPVVNGVGVTPSQLIATDSLAFGVSAIGTLALTGVSQPVGPVGTPVALELLLDSVGGHSITGQLLLAQLSVYELP